MKLNFMQLNEIVSLLPDPVFILSDDGHYIAYLGGVDSLSYHDGRLLVGKSLYEVLPHEKADWFLQQIHTAINRSEVQVVEYDLAATEVDSLDTNIGPEGILRFEGKLSPLTSRFDGQQAVLWLTRNVTRSHRLERQLRNQSETDPLTGLYNRRRFFKTLASLLNETGCRGRASLIMLDIDHFKNVNDNFGHLAGDAVLRHISRRITALLREQDLAARVGGEEFAFVLPQTRLDEANNIAERIRHDIELQVIKYDAHLIKVTVSLGGTMIMENDNCESAFSRVDQALYRAKDSGRNRVTIIGPLYEKANLTQVI